jgi:hypothetical protein
MCSDVSIEDGLCTNSSAPRGLDNRDGHCIKHPNFNVVDGTRECRRICRLEARHALRFVSYPAGRVDEHKIIGPDLINCIDVNSAQCIIKLLLELPNFTIGRDRRLRSGGY